MGVGRAIMSSLEADIVKRGHECATLESSPNAVGFYTKLGYTSVGLPDEGAVPMKKPLNPRLERTAEKRGRSTAGR
jgi:hypothetical protein